MAFENDPITSATSGNYQQAANPGTSMNAIGSGFQGFSNAFVPMNGFQASGAPIANQSFGHAINNGLGQFNQNYANQNALAAQLMAQSQGQGPNPALLAQQQASNQAIKQGSGQVASMKGISPALAQRMASQNSANMSQQAAGQGAMMQAQQQMGAQSSLGGLYGQMGNQQNTMQNTLQNAQAAQNNANVTMQSNLNNVNASVAAQNSQNQANAMGGMMGGLGVGGLSAMGLAHGGMVGYADGGSVQSTTPAFNSNFGFGSSADAGSVAKTPSKPQGGLLQHLADGGPVISNWGFNDSPTMDNSNPMSIAGQYLNMANPWASKSGGSSSKPKDSSGGAGAGASDGSMGGAGLASGPMAGGAGDAGGASALSGAAVLAAAHGGQIPHFDSGGLMKLLPLAMMALKQGGNVPGKAAVKGDSPKNDTVPAMLSPGEVVIPRSVMNSPNAPQDAAKFVAALLAKKGLKKGIAS